MKAYSEELVDFIEQNRLKYNINKLCEMIHNQFGKDITPKVLRKYFYRHNLDYKKQLCRRWNSTNAKPIGFESPPDKNGLVRIKINEKQWVYKQRYIYEQHYGKIPKDHKVVFLNGDKTDYRIENLAIAPNKEVLYIYGQELNSSNAEITKLGLQVAKLQNKILEKGKKNENSK